MAKTQPRHRPVNKRPQQKPRGHAGGRSPRPWYRAPWVPWAVGLLALAVVAFVLRPEGSDAPAPATSGSKPVVGGDLHSLVVDPDDPNKLYIGSHEGVSVSSDGGGTWDALEGLAGADAMGWGFTGDAMIVGGHPGLSVSTDGGETFEQRNDGLPSPDVHALGASDEAIYVGLAGAGTFASIDNGGSWEARSQEFGGAFMGRIQVDPSDAEHLLAPDLQLGVLESSDGGRTWERLGGVEGATWVSWDPSDPDHIVASGQGSVAVTTDGGRSWDQLEVPQGASIVELSPHDANVLYAAVLEAPEATVYVSRDGGENWDRP